MTGAAGTPSVAGRKVPKAPGGLSRVLVVWVTGSSESGSGKGTASPKDSMLAWSPEGAAGAGGTLYVPGVSTIVGTIFSACMHKSVDPYGNM